MTKKEFLERLEHKLRVLSKEEIQDILDEYSGYLDNKIQEGKSEEDAVKDFGNLNDLASEILAAYKLNDNYTQDKVGGILNNLVDIIIHVVDSITTFFKEKAPNMSVENLVRLGIYIILGLIFIAVLKIPFSIIEGLLQGIISWIFPWFLVALLKVILSIAINLVYLCFVMMLIVNFIRAATKEKDLTLKNFLRQPLMFQFDIHQSMFKKEPVQPSEVPLQQDKSELQQNEATFDDKLQQEPIEKEEPELFQYHHAKETAEYENDPQFQKELDEIKEEERNEWKQAAKNTKNNPISSLFLLLLQIITSLVLFPFFLINMGCCLAFGITIFLLFSGAKIWGIMLVLLGIIGVISGFISFLWKAVRPTSKQNKGKFISFLASFVILGVGLTLSFVEFSQYETMTYSQYLSNNSSLTEKVETYSLTSFETIKFNYLDNPIVTEVSAGKDDEIQIVFAVKDVYQISSYHLNSKEIAFEITDYPHLPQVFQAYHIILNVLRDQVHLVVSKPEDLAYSIKIRANQKTLDKLTMKDNIITIQQ